MNKTIFALAMILILAAISFADIPNTLNYQGRLMDQSGQPVLDGQYTVTFRLYTAASGGNMVWEEQQTVATQNGYFNTVLGNTTALTPSMFSQPLWAGMQVGTNSEMTPRQKLSTAAYAMTVADESITNEKLAPGAVTSDKISGVAGVPAGAIIIWRGAECPAGYKRVGEFDERFLRGAATPGGTGGSETHTHTMQSAGSHSHSYSGSTSHHAPGEWSPVGGSGWFVGPHSHTYSGTTSNNGNHTHTVDDAYNIPPYIDCVFCEKE